MQGCKKFIFNVLRKFCELCALFRGMEYLKTCVASPKNLENLGEFLVFLCQKVCDEKINVKKFIIKILMSVS